MSINTRPLEGLAILVVDDHRDTVEMLAECLRAYGATVVGAGNAKAALAVAETHVLDAVLIDLRMPGEDGWWFLRQLRVSATASASQYGRSGKAASRSAPTICAMNALKIAIQGESAGLLHSQTSLEDIPITVQMVRRDRSSIRSRSR